MVLLNVIAQETARCTLNHTATAFMHCERRVTSGCCPGQASPQSIAHCFSCAGRMRAEMLSGRLMDAERQRDDVMQCLDSYKRAAARAEKDWELERNNLHVRACKGLCCLLLLNPHGLHTGRHAASILQQGV